MIAAVVAFFLSIQLFYFVRYLIAENPAKGPAIAPQTFLCVVAVASLLGIGFLVALGPSQAGLLLVLSAGICLSLAHPVVAVSFFVANLLLRTWEVLPPNGVVLILPKFLAALCVLSWGLSSWKRKAYYIVWHRAFTVLVALLVWFSLSALFSGQAVALLKFELENFIPISVLAFLILNAFTTKEDLEILRKTLVISIVGVVACALYLTFVEPLPVAEATELAVDVGASRLTGLGLWANANDLASLIALCVPLTLLPLLRGKGSRIEKLSVAVALGILCLGLWTAQSRGAILALGACSAAYIVFCMRGRLQRWFGVLIITAVFTFFSLAIVRKVEDLSGSKAARWSYVIAGLGMVKDHPLFGVGLTNYPRFYERYTPSFTEWGERTAHSSWILVLAETGIMGFVLFALLYFVAVHRAWQLRLQSPELFLATLSYGVAMSFLSHTYIFLPYLLVAFVAAFGRSVQWERREEEAVKFKGSKVSYA